MCTRCLVGKNVRDVSLKLDIDTENGVSIKRSFDDEE